MNSITFNVEKVNKENKRLLSLLGCGTPCGAYCIDHRGSNADNHGRIACHSYIRRISDHENLTNYIGRLKYVQGFENWWAYITSYESPFGDLFRKAPDGWTFICDDPLDIKTVRGFRAPDELFDFEVYPLVYAFLICTRMCYEYENDVYSLSYLLDQGVEPNLAFLIARFLHIDPTTEAITIRSGGWDGAHKALSEQGYNPYGDAIGLIDVKLWIEGKYISKDIRFDASTSTLWKMNGKGKPLSSFLWDAYCTSTKSKFGATIKRLSSDNLKKMLEDFNKFVELRYTK